MILRKELKHNYSKYHFFYCCLHVASYKHCILIVVFIRCAFISMITHATAAYIRERQLLEEVNK